MKIDLINLSSLQIISNVHFKKNASKYFPNASNTMFEAIGEYQIVHSFLLNNPKYVNGYVYSLSSPANIVDPQGLWGVQVAGAFAGAAINYANPLIA